MLCTMLNFAPASSNPPLLPASPPPSPPTPSRLKRPTSPQLHPRKARRPTAYSPTESSDPNGPDWSPTHSDTGASRKANSLSFPPTSPGAARAAAHAARLMPSLAANHHVSSSTTPSPSPSPTGDRTDTAPRIPRFSSEAPLHQTLWCPVPMPQDLARPSDAPRPAR